MPLLHHVKRTMWIRSICGGTQHLWDPWHDPRTPTTYGTTFGGTPISAKQRCVTFTSRLSNKCITLIIVYIDFLKTLLKPKFTANSDTRIKEKEDECYIYFMDFLDECQGTSHKYTYLCKLKPLSSCNIFLTSHIQTELPSLKIILKYPWKTYSSFSVEQMLYLH